MERLQRLRLHMEKPKRSVHYRAKQGGTTMFVREGAVEYLNREAERRHRTPQGQMELMIDMFRMVVEEFRNDDVDMVRAEVRKLKALEEKRER